MVALSESVRCVLLQGAGSSVWQRLIGIMFMVIGRQLE